MLFVDTIGCVLLFLLPFGGMTLKVVVREPLVSLGNWWIPVNLS